MAVHTFNRFNYSVDLNVKPERDIFQIKSEKFKEIPTELYHFFELDRKHINSILDHYVYAGHPYDFNDPFDCNKELISFENTSFNDILELNNGIFKPDLLAELFNSAKSEDKLKLYDHLNWLLYNVIYMKVGIFCATANCESMEMWSYYSKHRGYAIKFDLSYFPKNYWGPFPINYTDNFEKIEYKKFKKASFIYQSNIKAQCWDHENEWRLIFYGPNVMKVPHRDLPKAHKRKFYFNPKAIKEIVLGYSFFEINEYLNDQSSQEKQVVKLRKKRKEKRKILKYILTNNIQTSIINLKRESSSTLGSKPIKIRSISATKYELSYVG
jgi:hypothetical protein